MGQQCSSRRRSRHATDNEAAVRECQLVLDAGERNGHRAATTRTRVALIELQSRLGLPPREVLIRELECLDAIEADAGVVYVWDSLRILIPWLCRAGLDEIAVTVQEAIVCSPLPRRVRDELLVREAAERLPAGVAARAREHGSTLDAIRARDFTRGAVEAALLGT